jgi:hypothetical protein
MVTSIVLLEDDIPCRGTAHRNILLQSSLGIYISEFRLSAICEKPSHVNISRAISYCEWLKSPYSTPELIPAEYLSISTDLIHIEVQ